MQESLITFKTAKLAKEVGFSVKDNYLYKWYNSLGKLHQWMYLQTDESVEFVAPTQSLLQKWLREVHSIHICLDTNIIDKKWFFVISNYEINKVYENINSDYYDTYEQTLEVGLQEALKLIK